MRRFGPQGCHQTRAGSFGGAFAVTCGAISGHCTRWGHLVAAVLHRPRVAVGREPLTLIPGARLETPVATPTVVPAALGFFRA